MDIGKEFSADEMIERLEASRIASFKAREERQNMSMRERVARALAKEGVFPEITERGYEGFFGLADAAIAAMREPTKAMLKAGADQADLADEGGWISGTPSQVWPAMIDAALSEESDG